MSTNKQKEVRLNKRWSKSEDLRLVRQIQTFPQNLHKCFMIVAEELGRTESAVAGRWYQHVSKDPANMCFFTASPKHCSKNRKSGIGEATTPSFWKSLMAVFRRFHL